MEAFQLLASTEFMDKLPQVERDKVRVYKSRLSKGSKVNLEGILQKNGFVKVKEAQWERKGIIK